MERLEEIIDQIEQELDEKDIVRELALKSSRAILRIVSTAVQKIHKGDDVKGLLEECVEEFVKMQSVLDGHPDILYSGLVDRTLVEFCELNILHSIIENKKLPSHKDLQVPPRAYILGLGDTIGELRRLTLESLRKGDISSADRYLNIMDEIYTNLMRFEYPSGLIPIKKIQDISRSLIDKTRGEFVTSISSKKLENKIEEHQSLLGVKKV